MTRATSKTPVADNGRPLPANRGALTGALRFTKAETRGEISALPIHLTVFRFGPCPLLTEGARPPIC
ncbi:hypothetical protein GCM10027028_60430 [Streptomyces sundarbansensis]